MNKNKKQKLLLIVPGILTIISLSIPGCSTRDYRTREDQETVLSDYFSDVKNTPSDVPELGTPDRNKDESANGGCTNVDTSISSGYYLSFGVLDEDVVIDGAGRNKSEVSVNGKNVVFPQGGIRSISIKSWSRKEKAYNPPKSGIIKYIDALESAVIVDSVPKNVIEEMVKIETHIIYLNSHDEFRTVNIINFGNGYHEISVGKDDVENFAKKVSIKSGTGEKYNQVFLRSMEAEKVIKKWLNWEKQGKMGFRLVQSASLSYDGNADGIKLAEKPLNKLKKYLETCRKTGGTPCGYENYFECVQNDGNQFHFSISADGESISTDKGVYIIDYPYNEKIVEIFKQIRKSANN